MDALRNLFISMLIVASTSVLAKGEPECSTWNGIMLSENVYFLDPQVEGDLQSALLDAGDDWGPFWIQARLEESSLSFLNKTPGLGLPFTIYHVEVNWISPRGESIAEATQSFPASLSCAPLSLFPGQSSRKIEITRPDVSEKLRLQLRVWVSPF